MYSKSLISLILALLAVVMVNAAPLAEPHTTTPSYGSYETPAYETPSYEEPDYEEPTYEEPEDYKTPEYKTPEYKTPEYKAPAYKTEKSYKTPEPEY